MPFVRANLSDPREDFGGFEVELTYSVPIESESCEKWREILEGTSRGLTNQTLRMSSKSTGYHKHKLTAGTHYLLHEDKKC